MLALFLYLALYFYCGYIDNIIMIDTNNSLDAKPSKVAEITRFSDGKFKPGVSGNPAGRPKGAVSGLTKCRGFIKDLLKKTSNQAIIYDALQEYLKDEPLDFFREFVLSGPGSSVSLQVDGEVIRPIKVQLGPPGGTVEVTEEED